MVRQPSARRSEQEERRGLTSRCTGQRLHLCKRTPLAIRFRCVITQQQKWFIMVFAGVTACKRRALAAGAPRLASLGSAGAAGELQRWASA